MLKRLLLFLLLFTGPVFAEQNLEWTQPETPFQIAGNIYYVGSKDLAAYLITTPQGHILINSNLKSSVPQIQKSVEALGFRYSDIKILLISQAHFDHAAGSALLKKQTGAKYMVMDADVPDIEDGGRSNFAYAKEADMFFEPTKVDRVLHDGDTVQLGATTLIAHRTGGHTKGCTTWTMQVKEQGRTYNVVIVGGASPNSGYKLVANREYPDIRQDFEQTYKTLRSLPCDFFLGAHGAYFGMKEKLARRKPGSPNPFIDPTGYKDFVDEREKSFYSELHKQERRD